MTKGVALCDRARLIDLKYAMHYQLAQLAAKSNSKAAFIAADKLIAEAETQKLAHWTCAFRFLRVGLSLKYGDRSDFAAIHKTMSAVGHEGRLHGHVPAQVIASLLQALVCLRTGTSESRDSAFRYISAARAHQLHPEMAQLRQMLAFTEYLDLSCRLLDYHPAAAAGERLEEMQNYLDEKRQQHVPPLQEQDFCLLDVGPLKNSEIEADTCAIFRKSAQGKLYFPLRWMSTTEIQVIGYLLSGHANLVKQQSGCSEKARRYTQYVSSVCSLVPKILVGTDREASRQSHWIKTPIMGSSSRSQIQPPRRNDSVVYE